MATLTPLTEATLDRLIAAYGLGVRKASRGIAAGTVNTSYALDLVKENSRDGTTEAAPVRVFLRLYEEQGTAGAEAEAELLVHLASHGVPTPSPIRTSDGRTTVLTVAEADGKPAVLFPWVDGDMLCQRAVTPAAAHAVGVALARLHRAGAPASSPLGAGRFGPSDLVLRCARVAASRDAEAAALAAELERRITDVARTRRADLPSGLVHGDLFRDNVLWHEGRIAALLDFESAHLGPFAYDIAVTILSWSFADDLDVAIARAIVDGYRTVRELDESEREGLFDEMTFASLRFAVTRITDDAIRVGKRWQRFVARREALDALGRGGLRKALGL